jgi:hypothetical protein
MNSRPQLPPALRPLCFKIQSLAASSGARSAESWAMPPYPRVAGSPSALELELDAALEDDTVDHFGHRERTRRQRRARRRGRDSAARDGSRCRGDERLWAYQKSKWEPRTFAERPIIQRTAYPQPIHSPGIRNYPALTKASCDEFTGPLHWRGETRGLEYVRAVVSREVLVVGGVDGQVICKGTCSAVPRHCRDGRR